MSASFLSSTCYYSRVIRSTRYNTYKLYSRIIGMPRYKSALMRIVLQETLNYWKQLPHVLKYFREKENPTARLPQSFMQGFLEAYMLFPSI